MNITISENQKILPDTVELKYGKPFAGNVTSMIEEAANREVEISIRGLELRRLRAQKKIEQCV